MSIPNTVVEQITLIEALDPLRGRRAGQSTALLSILLGPDEGHSCKVVDECIVGRGSNATFRLTDRGVSRAHARIRRSADGRFTIEDLGSRNGIQVNGKNVSVGALEPGDRVQIGPRCLLLFSVQDDLEESLAHAKSLEIIRRLSAGINHDFNNLLCVVLANAAHLLAQPRELTLADAEVRECLQDIRAAADNGADLTARLATLIQGGAAGFEPVDFSDLCEKTVAILRDTFAKNVRIQVQVQPGIMVRGIAAHLRHLMINPCLNARDAMPEGGTLWIDVALRNAQDLTVAPLVRSERYVVVTIRDTGTGMDPTVLASAFEAFFTTRALDVGGGLGLFIVRKVAADMGGCVDLQSRKGEGTTLRVVLPATGVPVVAEVDDDRDGGRAPREHTTLDASFAELALTPSMLDIDDPSSQEH